jgi:hypothetical protein
MRRSIVSLGALVMLLLYATAAPAQTTKTATGTVSEIAPDAITVKVDGKDMKFSIDAKTQVITPGGGTKSRAAEASGKGVGVMDLVKVGQNVQVRYEEAGMRAMSIRTVAAVPPASSSAPKAQTSSGVVTSISGSSLVIKGSAGEMTFSVDEKTTVVGAGVGTAGKKIEAEGKKPTISDLLHEGDTVSVTYRDMEGTKHASTVRITRRKS